jgi:predicted component of type VI protein secretion system
MKLMLSLATPRSWAGKLVPVSHSPFVIGREPGCHLRADTPTVGARHCAVLVQGDHVMVRDLAGSPGTCVNGQPVPGQQELHDRDRVRVGVLEFTIRLEAEAACPGTESVSTAAAEETAAKLLLALEAEETLGNPQTSPAAGETLPTGETNHCGEPNAPSPAGAKPARPEPPDTAEAARQLLARIKKPRGKGLGGRGVMAP